MSQGVWIQTQDTLLANHQGTIPLPAASITKVATSLAVLKKLGPDHRFETKIGYIGTLQNGELNGDLVIEGGADPFFVWEDAIALGNLLNQNGIRNVSGNLIVVGPFYMNYEPDPVTSGTLLQQGLDHTRWPAEAQTQYQTLPADTAKPEVAIAGNIQTAASRPDQVKPLIQHRSLPVAELLKKMNQYSNNAMSEMLAEYVGGATQVAQMAAQEAGVPSQEIQLINGSGLGVDNRISPRAACGMFQAIAHLLHLQEMTIADIFAVIGTDPGVHNERPLPQKFVMKSGTLNRVSSIAGALPTKNQGVIWFAVINGEGNVDQFRAQQETLLQNLMQSWGTTNKTFDLITANPTRQNLTTTSKIVLSN
ncbi:carboxypeptidase [Acaryochloris marina MBIC10699]|nr:carboxypeptidase [Acaryochloris marina MBIC10699]